MHFYVANIQRIDVGVPHDPIEDGNLVAFVRSCDGFCLATMICKCSVDDTEDWIVVRLCILEPLENDRPHAICSAVAASTVIEGITVSYRVRSVPDPNEQV